MKTPSSSETALRIVSQDVATLRRVRALLAKHDARIEKLRNFEPTSDDEADLAEWRAKVAKIEHDFIERVAAEVSR